MNSVSLLGLQEYSIGHEFNFSSSLIDKILPSSSSLVMVHPNLLLSPELKEQLLARSSRVDDIERLKTEFKQQRRDLQEQNESELENLRTYFEQRLRTSEESHREEIALLQLRLIEGALEESVLKTGDSR